MDSISRHEQLLRVFHLVDLLFGARRPLTIAEIKRSLRDRGVIDEMSDKSIRRDVDFLAKFGYAVKQTKQRTPKGTTCQQFHFRGAGVSSLCVYNVAANSTAKVAPACAKDADCQGHARCTDLANDVEHRRVCLAPGTAHWP